MWRTVLLWPNLGKGATMSEPLNPASSALAKSDADLLVASEACMPLDAGSKTPVFSLVCGKPSEASAYVRKPALKLLAWRRAAT